MNFCHTKVARFLRSTSARAEMDGAVGLEPMGTGENIKECCGLCEWEQPGDNASLHRLASIVPGMVWGGGHLLDCVWFGEEKLFFHRWGAVPALD